MPYIHFFFCTSELRNHPALATSYFVTHAHTVLICSSEALSCSTDVFICQNQLHIYGATYSLFATCRINTTSVRQNFKNLFPVFYQCLFLRHRHKFSLHHSMWREYRIMSRVEENLLGQRRDISGLCAVAGQQEKNKASCQGI